MKSVTEKINERWEKALERGYKKMTTAQRLDGIPPEELIEHIPPATLVEHIPMEKRLKDPTLLAGSESYKAALEVYRHAKLNGSPELAPRSPCKSVTPFPGQTVSLIRLRGQLAEA